MQQHQLVVLPGDDQPAEETEEEEESLRNQVNEILDEHKANLKDMVKKWMVYHADFGTRTLSLDNLEIALNEQDRKFVVEWLRQEKFTVHASRFGRRVIIELPPKE